MPCGQSESGRRLTDSKAAGDCRTPRGFAICRRLGLGASFWSAPGLWRFYFDAPLRTAGPTVPRCHLASPKATGDWPESKAAEDCRTPRRFAMLRRRQGRSRESARQTGRIRSGRSPTHPTPPSEPRYCHSRRTRRSASRQQGRSRYVPSPIASRPRPQRRPGCRSGPNPTRRCAPGRWSFRSLRRLAAWLGHTPTSDLFRMIHSIC